MVFKNINYNNTVGNITLEGNKIIYKTDDNSVNNNEIKEEIDIKDIDMQKLKKELYKNNMHILIIETQYKKFEFEFIFEDEYKNFIDVLNKIMLH